MDPVTLSAIAGGVTGAAIEKITERVFDVLLPEFRGATAKARQDAINNAMHMLVAMEARLGQVEAELTSRGGAAHVVDEALGNADFSYTVRQALLGAARTGSDIRHEILSRAVVERLLGAPDSIQAVASAQAIEALGKLSSVHLDLLGLAALLYYAGPVIHAPAEILKESDPDMPALVTEPDIEKYDAWHKAVREEGQLLVERYVTWLRTQLSPYNLQQVEVSPLDLAHLVSASCATYDRNLKRRLTDVLRSPSLTSHAATELHRSYGWGLRLDHLGHHDEVETLEALWEAGLQHLSLAPAGLLIGSIVHEFRSGEEIPIRWNLALSDAFQDERVWNGRGIDPRFVDAIDRELMHKEQARRRARGDNSIG